MKTLVYRMGGLGDSLLIFPVLEILTKKGHEITVWGNTEYFILAELVGICRKITFYEPKEEFDHFIVFSKGENALNLPEKSTYVNPLPEENIWIVSQYLKKLNLSKNSFSKNLNLPLTVQKHPNLCIIHPGSGSRKKLPDVSFFFDLEKMLKNTGLNVHFIIGPAEVELLQVFKKNVICPENTIELSKLLLGATLYIGFDSGVSHLSSYLGVPSVVIFGPTDPNVWHPIGEKLFIIRYHKCKPCFPNICDEKRCLDKNYLLSELESILKNQKFYFNFKGLTCLSILRENKECPRQ